MKIARPKFRSTVLRDVPLYSGLPEIEDLEAEIDEYVAILKGDKPAPVDHGTLTLMEVADAYYTRACEIAIYILRKERQGSVMKGSKYYRFRTGELRQFADLAKRASDLGSRRLTKERLDYDMEHDQSGLFEETS